MTLISTFRRSLINKCVLTAKEVLHAFNIKLPRYADWSVDEWQKAGMEAQEIRDVMLGWDVTDFGSNRFDEIGRTLFTLRNGQGADRPYPKAYAEKLLIEPEGQRSPMHYHRSKREDIINRGGGNIMIALSPVNPDGTPGNGTLSIQIDGITRRISAGEPTRLAVGESLTIPPETYHQFWAEEGTGVTIDGKKYTLSGEISSICDDWNDNVFIDSWATRFPPIIEDEPKTVLLCHEYPKGTNSSQTGMR